MNKSNESSLRTYRRQQNALALALKFLRECAPDKVKEVLDVCPAAEDFTERELEQLVLPSAFDGAPDAMAISRKDIASIYKISMKTVANRMTANLLPQPCYRRSGRDYWTLGVIRLHVFEKNKQEMEAKENG